MPRRALNINIPAHFFIALNKTEVELMKEMKLYAAINFYQFGKLTIGKASEFAEIPRWEFENILAERKIPISQLEFDDIKADFEKLRDI